MLRLLRADDHSRVKLADVGLVLLGGLGPPRQGMQRERHLELLRGGPEGVIVMMRVGSILGRRGPDEGAFEPHLGAALEFAARAVNVEQRNHREAGEPARRVTTELSAPVVVNAEAVFLECGVFNPEQYKAPHRGVKHGRVHPVEFPMSLRRAAGSHPPAGALSSPASRNFLSNVLPAANAPETRNGGNCSQMKNRPLRPSGSLTIRGARSRKRWLSPSVQRPGGSSMCASASIILTTCSSMNLQAASFCLCGFRAGRALEFQLDYAPVAVF